MWTEQDHSRVPQSIPSPGQLFKRSMTYHHGPQGSGVRLHSVTLGCPDYAADAGFGGPQALLSPKSLQAPWQIVPASVAISRGAGKALRHRHVRVRPNARVYGAP